MRAVPSKYSRNVLLEHVWGKFCSDDIGEAFSQQQPRYTKKHSIAHDKSVDLFGNDANPLLHQSELAEIHLRKVLTGEYDNQTLFQPDDEMVTLLYFVAYFHDIGESEHPILTENGLTIVGDIPTGQKTPADRVHERENRLFLLNQLFPYLDPDFIHRADHIIEHQPLQGDELWHDIFQAAHDLQMHETSEIALASSKRSDVDPSDQTTLREIYDEVQAHVKPHLRTAAYLATCAQHALDRDDHRLTHIVNSENRQYHSLCCE